MSGTIPPLILYPLYPGGPQVKGNSGTLNANSSFRTRANDFVPAYGVNLPSDLRGDEADTYFTLSGPATISRRPISAIESFNTNLGFDATVLGGIKKVAVPAVAPAVPNLYKEAEKLLSISELNMADLLAQPEFRIPSIGLGLKVTTDGMGGVDNVAISPGTRGVMGRPDATGGSFGGLNSAEISRGAMFTTTDMSIDTGKPTAQPINNQQGNMVTPSQNSPQPQFTFNKPERSAGIFNLENLEELALQALQSQSADLDRITPELERLYSLQANQNIAGRDAVYRPDVTEAQQLAATQVGLGVKTSDSFQANLVGLINANKQSESYASAFAPGMEQVMNGKIAGAPWVSSQTSGSLGDGSRNASGFEMGAAVADAMSRKGKGSYIPFQMQSGTQEQGFGGSNPFMGANTGAGTGTGGGSGQFSGQPDRQYRPRKPLTFVA